MVWDLLVSIKLDIRLWQTWWQAITWTNAINQDYREWWFNQSHIIPNGCMDARGTNFQWNSISINYILWYLYANWPHGIIPYNYFHTILATNTWFLFWCVKHQLTAYKFNAVNYFGSKWNTLRSKPSDCTIAVFIPYLRAWQQHQEHQESAGEYHHNIS